MPFITLTEEQLRVLNESDEVVELRDEQGNLVAHVAKSIEDEIEEAQRRLASDQPRWSSEQVQELFRRLSEKRQTDGITENELQESLARFRAGEPI